MSPAPATPSAKLMFLLWGDDLGVRLHDPVLLEQLAAVGGVRVQLNLDDAPVADALRLQTFADPVGAVLSAWTSLTATLAIAVWRTGGWALVPDVSPASAGRGAATTATASASTRSTEGRHGRAW